jgi:DNA (cytosine-5)-methyltransferase 1
MNLSSIEIFAGAGGLAIGAHLAGFKCELMIDSSHSACETLRWNGYRQISPMASSAILEFDVRTYDFRPLSSRIDLLLGGPPCQPFSAGGLRRHRADDRNMFPEAVRALSEIRPKSFLFENVKGLVSGASRNYAELIRLQLQYPDIALTLKNFPWDVQLSRLEDLATAKGSTCAQYNVVMQILNAADFGVPQKRERVFFVGFRRDLGIEWHFPMATHSREALFLDQSIKGNYWERHEVPVRFREFSALPDAEGSAANLIPWRTTRDAIADLPHPYLTEATHQVTQHYFVPGAKEYRGHTGSPIDQPSKALKAGVNGVPGGENMLRLPDGSLRYFTIRECARLQTFNDEFEVLGTRSKQIRQLGNAVPCLLARVILDSMRRSLDIAMESSKTGPRLAAVGN